MKRFFRWVSRHAHAFTLYITGYALTLTAVFTLGLSHMTTGVLATLVISIAAQLTEEGRSGSEFLPGAGSLGAMTAMAVALIKAI